VQQISKRLLNWASILEPETLAQAERTASAPFIYPHLVLMPDAHLGKGATVGSVIPTLGAIIPAAVGVDIGCGMIAVRTGHRRDHLAGLERARLRVAIESAIPLSAGWYNTRLTEHAADLVADLTARADQAEFDPGDYAPNWPLQLGTLGSGNHFIEVTVDEQDWLWLFLHSGSRARGRQQDRPAPHPGGPGPVPELVD
jgi:tRNA-splicing ligase RtcB